MRALKYISYGSFHRHTDRLLLFAHSLVFLAVVFTVGVTRVTLEFLFKGKTKKTTNGQVNLSCVQYEARSKVFPSSLFL